MRTSLSSGVLMLVRRDAASSALIALYMCGASLSTAERTWLDVVTNSEWGAVCVVMAPTLWRKRSYAKVQCCAGRLDHFRSRSPPRDGYRLRSPSSARACPARRDSLRPPAPADEIAIDAVTRGRAGSRARHGQRRLRPTHRRGLPRRAYRIRHGRRTCPGDVGETRAGDARPAAALRPAAGQPGRDELPDLRVAAVAATGVGHRARHDLRVRRSARPHRTPASAGGISRARPRGSRLA